jgi:hypothetical protein
MTEKKAREQLAEDEKRHLVEGGVSVHATSASAFVVMGLEVEEAQ